MAMGKMLDKYKNVSSLDFKEEVLPRHQAYHNKILVCNCGKKDSKDNNINCKLNSLHERWFCYWMNRRIDKLKRKVLASNKKIEA